MFEIKHGLSLLLLLLALTSYKAKAYTLSIKAAPISGTVTDERNQTLPGVTVRVKNSTQGITTDANGKYTISADPDAILVFSFIGYITQEHPVSNSVVLNVKLLPQANMQNEVVAIGYQTIRKSDVTGSIASVKSSDLNLFAPTLGQALAGKVAGVQV